MLIHVPQKRSTAQGIWILDHDTGKLSYLDTNKDSTISTKWPIMDRFETLHISRAVDSLLNAAIKGRECLDRAMRARWAGDKLACWLTRQCSLISGIGTWLHLEAWAHNGACL